MHYRNGREAKNGDKIVQLGDKGEVTHVGQLRDLTPGNDYCNGSIAPLGEPLDTFHSSLPCACLCDCLHVDDLAALLKEKGLDQRPRGM